ncbi:MAG: hypothetical protein JG781_2663, partial [Peptococcaceae bacterium]|nr:hypothetical protein [Peptococcaceae bacterium]
MLLLDKYNTLMQGIYMLKNLLHQAHTVIMVSTLPLHLVQMYTLPILV